MSHANEVAYREHARMLATAGLGDFARAFNHCHNPTIQYRYSEAVQKRFLELGAELVALVERGQILPRSAAVHAQDDASFQRHMSVLLAQPDKPAA